MICKQILDDDRKKNNCKDCPTLSKCKNSKVYQKTVVRHVLQEYIERAEDIRHSPIGTESYSLRSQTIERVFADAKEKHSMRYTQYRGLRQVSNWVTLKYAAMNLKKLALWKARSFCAFFQIQLFSALHKFNPAFVL